MACFEILPGRKVGNHHPCFIIAEIGQNHQGDITIAKKLIQTALECGADCVKFQKSDLPSRFNKQALNRSYVGTNSFGTTYGEHRRHIEFSDQEFIELSNYSSHLGIPFTASGMDKASVDFLDHLDVPFFKIGSGDANNLPLLTYTANLGKPLVISTGMQELKTVCTMYDSLQSINNSLSILQCTSAYPTPPKDVNLRVIKGYLTLGVFSRNPKPLDQLGQAVIEEAIPQEMIAAACRGTAERCYEIIEAQVDKEHCLDKCVRSLLQKTYQRYFPKAVIGYSGHEKGIGISVAAIALGAKILERHLTLDHNWKGSDHKASLEPCEFKQLVYEIRNVEAALMCSEKILQESETECYKKLAKTIVASTYLSSGTSLQEDMLDIKVAEPKGWKAENMINLIGRKLLHDVDKDDSILEDNVL